MSSFRFSLNSVPLGLVCFISLILLFFPAFVLPLYPSLFLLYSFFYVSLCTDRHSLSHAYTHTLSLGYYQDKSIWSIQGSGCHFIHIFSSLVTLLKATASIYPEWMNAPTDETQEKMRPAQPEMTTANQPVISKHVLEFLCFKCNRKQLGDSGAFGTVFSIHLRVKRQRVRLPALQWQENGCWDFQLGGKNEMLQSVEAQSRESWSRDKNVSIHANWCPDPPPGCLCLLSGEGIKGPFTRHGDFHFFLASTLFHLVLLFLLWGQL